MRNTDVVKELSSEDLGGFPLEEISCRGCSGYGNCGYRMYRLFKGKPICICHRRKDELTEGKAGGNDVPKHA